MKKLSAWTATSIAVLCLWLALFLGTGGWQGRLVLGMMMIAALIWGFFRLVTYRPEHERGAGTLEEVRQRSRLTPLDEPVLVCLEIGEKKDEDDREQSPLTG